MRALLAGLAALLLLVASPAVAACTSAAGDGFLLIRATVLAGDAVLRPGEVLAAPDGLIACVGQCEALHPAAARIDCPEAILSPGFINPHEHLDFGAVAPTPDSGVRYSHRHDWRRGMNGYRSLETFQPTTDPDLVAWAELRHLLAGETSVMGLRWAPGVQRNLDVHAGLEGLRTPRALYITFPFDDIPGIQRTRDCDYGPHAATTEEVAAAHAYVMHLGEGAGEAARNEVRCAWSPDYDRTPLVGGGGLSQDLMLGNVTLLHGIGVERSMMAELARRGVVLGWSPRSNLSLYGRTLDVGGALQAGVPVALGTDWLPSGSLSLPREAACALDYARARGLALSGRTLWTMMTLNGAKAARMEGLVGVIAKGAAADLILVDAAGADDPYLAVALAPPERIAAVLRGGRLLAGDEALVGPLVREACDPVDMGGRAKRVCLAADAGKSYAALKVKAEAAKAWPAFFPGGLPPVEPPCREGPVTPPR